MSNSNAVANVNEASKCRRCKEEACAEEFVHSAFDPQEVLLFACRSCPPRKVKCWYFCKTCSKRFNYSSLRDVSGHANRKAHAKLKAIESSPRNLVPDPTVPLPCSPVAQLPAFSQDIFVQDISMSDDMNLDLSAEDISVIDGMDDGIMDVTPEENAAAAAEENATASTGNSECPQLNMEGNEWLAKEFKDVPRAGRTELDLVFSHASVSKMKHFWGSERFCGFGKEEACTGGGLMYITSRCFQQASSDCQLLPHRCATLKESMYQFKRMIQHCSSSDKQRKRQADLDAELIAEREALKRECDMLSRMLVDRGGLPVKQTTESFLVNTFIPKFKLLRKHCGRNNGKHSCSMLNLLPPRRWQTSVVLLSHR